MTAECLVCPGRLPSHSFIDFEPLFIGVCSYICCCCCCCSVAMLWSTQSSLTTTSSSSHHPCASSMCEQSEAEHVTFNQSERTLGLALNKLCTDQEKESWIPSQHELYLTSYYHQMLPYPSYVPLVDLCCLPGLLLTDHHLLCLAADSVCPGRCLWALLPVFFIDTYAHYNVPSNACNT